MALLGDLIKASSIKNWSLTGRQQLVKVVSASGHDYMMGKPEENRFAGGYITEIRYLWGLTNREIEGVLGLRPFELKHVAFVFGLSRLPTANEVDFKLSTAFPDGKSPWGDDGKISPTYLKDKAKAEAEFAAGNGSKRNSYWPVVDFYPIGSNQVPQWRIKDGVEIPISGLIATVTPERPFPRENGSTKPYTPHNKGGIKVSNFT